MTDLSSCSEMRKATLIVIAASAVALAAIVTVFTAVHLHMATTVVAACAVLIVGMMLADHLGYLRGQHDVVAARHDEPELSYGGSE